MPYANPLRRAFSCSTPWKHEEEEEDPLVSFWELDRAAPGFVVAAKTPTQASTEKIHEKTRVNLDHNRAEAKGSPYDHTRLFNEPRLSRESGGGKPTVDRSQARREKDTNHSVNNEPIVSPPARAGARVTPHGGKTRINVSSTGELRPHQDEHIIPPQWAWQNHMVVIRNRATDLYRRTRKGKPLNPQEERSYSEGLHYHGKRLPPQRPDPTSFLPPVPWAAGAISQNRRQSWHVLSTEIERFAAWMMPTAAETAARSAVEAEVRKLASRRTGSDYSDLELFGSGKTKLIHPMSDLDLRFTLAEDSAQKDDVSELSRRMTKIFAASQLDFHEISFVYGAYPVLNARHRRTGIRIQIVCAPSTAPQQAITAKYLDEIRNLHALYLVIRTMFGMRGLVDVYTGGVGSYGLLMMLVAALRRQPSTINPGPQLIQFLHFYRNLDTAKYGVAIHPHTLFKKHDTNPEIATYIEAAHRRGDPVRAGQWAIGQRRKMQPYLLCLQDPANPTNDLGRKGNAMRHYQETMASCHGLLKRDLKDFYRGEDMNEDEALLIRLVGRCDVVYGERRRAMEEYGLEVLAKEVVRPVGPDNQRRPRVYHAVRHE